MHFKCSPEVSKGYSLWYVVVEWVAHHLYVSLSEAILAVLHDTLVLITVVLLLHNHDQHCFGDFLG
jgi:hypothetical protein